MTTKDVDMGFCRSLRLKANSAEELQSSLFGPFFFRNNAKNGSYYPTYNIFIVRQYYIKNEADKAAWRAHGQRLDREAKEREQNEQ